MNPPAESEVFEYLKLVADQVGLAVEATNRNLSRLAYELRVYLKERDAGTFKVVSIPQEYVHDCMAGKSPERCDHVRAHFESAKSELLL
jgi:hypothetical protein